MFSGRSQIDSIYHWMIYVGMTKKRDHSLELLMDLDGLNFSQEGGYWVKYEVSTVEKTPERPHGIKYSLTLHDPQRSTHFWHRQHSSTKKAAWPGRKINAAQGR